MPELDYSKLLEIARTPVESSNIAAVGFDELARIIVVEFDVPTAENSVYAYLDCDKALYEDFLSAESKGKFFHQRIRNSKRTVLLT